MTQKILLIIDPQYDFISGSLGIKGSEDKMLLLSKYINDNPNKYDKIIITVDWHPDNHISFRQWKKHCLQHTVGAAVFQPIIDAINDNDIDCSILEKGDYQPKEEYSIMENFSSSRKLLRYFKEYPVKQIDICGIANEFCVLNTVKDLVEKYDLGEKINILKSFVVAINDETVLINYAKDHNLKIE